MGPLSNPRGNRIHKQTYQQQQQQPTSLQNAVKRRPIIIIKRVQYGWHALYLYSHIASRRISARLSGVTTPSNGCCLYV